MLIAEDLLLLLLGDESGKPLVGGNALELGLAGALLFELALLGRVGVADGNGEGKPGRLLVRSGPPLGDPVLDAASARLQDRVGKRAGEGLRRLRPGLVPELLRRLAEQGLLREHRTKAWGVFPVSRWPVSDGRIELRLRNRVGAALLGGEQPDRRTAAIVGFLVALRAVPRVFATGDLRALHRRAEEVADGGWPARAVRRALDQAKAAAVNSV